MNRDTIIRIAIPTALYESVKGKVLNTKKITEVTAEELNEPWVVWLIVDGGPKKAKWTGPKQKVNTVLTNTWNAYGDGDAQIGAMPEAEWNKENLNEAKKPSAGMTKKEKSETKEGIKDIFTKKGATKQKGKTIIPKGDKKLDMKVFDDETAKAPIYKDKIADAKKK
jgi:hypothetical protein